MNEPIVEAIVFVAISGVFVIRQKQEQARVKRENEKAIEALNAALKKSEREAQEWQSFSAKCSAELSEARQTIEANREAGDDVVDKAFAAADRAAQLLETERRKSSELFTVVESVLKERDQWKEMWFTQSREHLNAQNALEHAVEQARTWLRSALIAVNKHREEKSLPPLPFGLDPKDPPVGTAAQFEKLLIEAQRAAPEHVDGIALRDRIVAGEAAK